MRKTVIVLVMLLGLCQGINLRAADKSAEAVNATWTFISVADKPTVDEMARVEDGGNFGKEVSCLYSQLEQLCVKRVPIVPGDPTTRIVFKKGDIYNAVRRISKGLENDLEDKALTADEATDKMLRVLNVAISAYYSEDSKSFEKALRSSKKDYHKLLAVFDKVSLED